MEPSTRRERLEQLLRLAQTYRGWHRKQLAKALGRDTTKLVPESGLPKLDLLMDLAKVLDWPVEDVAEYIWKQSSPDTDSSETPSNDFAALEVASKSAHREGRYANAVLEAERAFEVAKTSEERAIAATREASGWDGLGRYTKALDATRRGIAQSGVSLNRRLILQSNLANQYYTLWQLLEARTLAQDLIQRFQKHPPASRSARVTQAFSHYVRGHSYRRLMALEAGAREEYALAASHDLSLAQRFYNQLADDFEDESFRGIGNTCRCGRVEAEVELGERTADSAIADFSSTLTAIVDPDDYPVGDWLESFGWCCIFGCNVALRHVDDPREMQHLMTLFTTKADEIAERLDNWSIRERVFTMDYVRRQRFADWTGIESEWTLDKEDVRVITGTMGRFPAFQRTGWRILESAKLVEN